MDDVVTPKLKVPFKITAQNRAAVIEQDSMDDVQQCVVAILRTPLGTRVEEPEFGIHDPTFSTVDIEALTHEVQEWEDRATTTIVEEAIDTLNDFTQRVRVDLDIGGERG